MRPNLLKIHNISYSLNYLLFRNSQLKFTLNLGVSFIYSLRIFTTVNNSQPFFLLVYSLPFRTAIIKNFDFSYTLFVQKFEDLIQLRSLLNAFDVIFIESFFISNNFINDALFHEIIKEYKNASVLFLHNVSNFKNLNFFKNCLSLFFVLSNVVNLKSIKCQQLTN